MSERKVEEVLEYIWVASEDTSGDVSEVERSAVNKRFGVEPASIILDKMRHEGHVVFNNGNISLTSTGTKQAEMVIRRHRLAERLLHDVLEYSSEDYESAACQFEHYVGDDVVASICILLGHPSNCPHGRAIPRGECCSKTKTEVTSLIVPLTEMRTGDKGKVVYITTKFHHRLDRISGIGILPGAQISIQQRTPTYVIQIGESQVALDHNIASGIYLRRQCN